MATFKVGQRVKKVRDREPQDYCRGRRLSSVDVVIGHTGTVAGFWGDEIGVLWDGVRDLRHHTGQTTSLPYMLAPLTDPGCESFIASLEKLAREPVAPALPVKERA